MGQPSVVLPCDDDADVEARRAPKLSQEVARAIATAIRNGEYQPGSRLESERVLAHEFDVSRTTIREAIVALEALGLAQVRRGSGVYVLKVPSHPIEGKTVVIEPLELAEARRMFEGESAALAAAMITDDEIDNLTHLMQVLATNEHSAAREEADRNFHIAISVATRNPAIAQMVERLWDMHYPSPTCRKMFDRMRDMDNQSDYEDHIAIFRAIHARDPAGARNAMHAHLNRMIDAILLATEADAVEQARSAAAMRREEIARRLSIVATAPTFPRKRASPPMLREQHYDAQSAVHSFAAPGDP